MGDLVDLSNFTRVKKGKPQVSQTGVLKKNDHRGIVTPESFGYAPKKPYTRIPGSENLFSIDKAGFDREPDYERPSEIGNVVPIGKDTVSQEVLESDLHKEMERLRKLGYDRLEERWIRPGFYIIEGERPKENY